MCTFNCNKCNKTIYQCQSCATLRNFCKDRKAARRHLRECHKLRNKNNNAIKGNDIEELSKI